jgi:4-amino-4-deoxy-L-arabinose transferase-like glycosyltransferase
MRVVTSFFGRRRFAVASVAVVLLALAARVAWLAYVPGGLSPQRLPDVDDRGPAYERLLIQRLTDDQAFYARSAQYLADGEGYREPFSGAVTARWAPGYPMVLAGLYKLAGADLRPARVANALFGGVATWLTIAIGSRLASRGAGLLAGAIYALFPAPIYMTSLMMTEPLFTAGLLFVLWLALEPARDGAAPAALLLGVVLGAVTLVRPEAVLLVLGLAAYWWRRALPARRQIVAFMVTLAGALSLLLPWTARNALTLDAFVPLSTGSGGALIQGHHRDADGSLNQAIYDDLRARYAHLAEPRRQIEENRAGMRESLKFATQHPLDELALVPKKLYHLYRVDPGGRTWAQLERWGVEERDALEGLADAYYLAVVLVAAGGAVVVARAWREPGWTLIASTIVIWSAVYGFVYVGDGRYHAPLLPLFTILAAHGLLRAFFEPGRQPEVSDIAPAS